MFVPPDLEFYPRLLLEGPLRQRVAQLIRVSDDSSRRGRLRRGNLFTQYRVERLKLLATILRRAGLGWCDLCHQLVPAANVRTVLRHGTYITMDTDCSYGPPFPRSNGLHEVRAVCSLHSEIFEEGNTIQMSVVTQRRGRLFATVDGAEQDVTAYDKRETPDDETLRWHHLEAVVVMNVPPPLEITHTGILRMAGNPYVVLAGGS